MYNQTGPIATAGRSQPHKQTRPFLQRFLIRERWAPGFDVPKIFGMLLTGNLSDFPYPNHHSVNGRLSKGLFHGRTSRHQ